MNRICVIGVYFGNLPKYFKLWEKSAAANPTIDFFVFTDQKVEYFSDNIKIVQMSLIRMKALAEKKLSFPDISLDRPYKCCDFKPVYGLIFQDYIQRYDYWGHCDFDLIFGDLQGFFDKYDLYAYDKFLTLGHLTLYRNIADNMRRYQSKGAIVDYRTVFSVDNSYAFDELQGISRIYTVNGYSQFTKRIFCDVASIYERYRDIEEYPLDIKAVNHKMQVYYWQNGHVYRKWFDKQGEHLDEYIYIHFKKRPNFDLTFNYNTTNAFYISNLGFFPMLEEPDVEAAKAYNRYYPIRETYETVRNIAVRMKKKLRTLSKNFVK